MHLNFVHTCDICDFSPHHFTFPTPSEASRSHPPQVYNPFLSGFRIGVGGRRSGQEYSWNTSHTYISHRHREVKISYCVSRRAGGRKRMSSDTGTTWSDFLLISPFSPGRSLRIREFGLSAEEAPQRRRRRRARIWSRKAGEVLTFHDGARPPRPPRIPLFAGHERVESRESGPMRDVDGSSWFEGRRGTVSDCERARPVHRTPYSVARIRKYVSTQLRATSPPLSLDFKLALSRFYHWDALILRSFSLRNGAYHLAEDYLDPTSSSHRQWKEMKGNPSLKVLTRLL